MDINDILVKHWILFEYDTKDSVYFDDPHHLFNVGDSIHFKTLVSGDFSDYNKLIETTKQLEHSEIIYRKLINDFKVELLSPIKLEWNDKYDKYVVLDGCHRLAILKYKNLIGDTNIPITYFKIIK